MVCRLRRWKERRPEDRCERTREVEGTPVVEIDLMFGKTNPDEKLHPVMNAMDGGYHLTITTWCDLKGGRTCLRGEVSSALRGAARAR